jgi:hypothetical protein
MLLTVHGTAREIPRRIRDRTGECEEGPLRRVRLSTQVLAARLIEPQGVQPLQSGTRQPRCIRRSARRAELERSQSLRWYVLTMRYSTRRCPKE